MDILMDDINREFSRIKEKISKGTSLDEEDLKIILLSTLREEEQVENK